MRRSQITLLAAIGVVALGIVVLVVLVRLTLSSFASDPDAGTARAAEVPSDFTTRAEDLTGFDGVLIQDSWDVDIRQGDDWRVVLSVPEERQANLRVRVEDGRLVLATERGRRGWQWGWFGRDERYRAEIVVPTLDSIEVQGSADIGLYAFEGDELAVTVAGAVNMEARDSRFEALSLVVSGASNIDFGRVPVVDVNVRLSGASNVMLDMAGGRLTGELSGFGNVLYSGTVSEENVNVSGFGRVGRED